MAFSKIVFVMLLFHILYILIYNDCKRVTNVLLGSSLPVIGGGGTMKKFRKFDLLILILKLLVHLIDWLK